jgi:vacuolar-type H+-ATPase subunit E/Vma4
MSNQGHNTIINGINGEAQKMALSIIEEAKSQVEKQYASWERQKKQQLAQAQKEGQKRADQAVRAAKSQRIIACKRNQLKAQEELIQEIILQVQAKLAHKIEDSNYSQVLEDWIVEAGLGLNLPEGVVATSAQERPLITQDLLQRASRRILEIAGRQMLLTLDSKTSLPAQGIVLCSKDGGIAFANQVPVRIQRFQSQIRHIIYTLLFKED